MSLELSSLGVARNDADARSGRGLLHIIIVAMAVSWTVAFIALGLRYQLQMYGDGSLFSYSVAVQDAWSFHWHNISGRLTTYVLSCLPAEAYVALTGNAYGGVQLYGALFFGAQLLGLAATRRADRSPGRIIFRTACLSTACLCPLVFGFPTEMWMAHAIFWPALALCHYGRGGAAGALAVFLTLFALVFTHEGALILAGVILAGLSLRGLPNARFLVALGAFLAALSIWAFAKVALPPDGYDGPMMARAAEHFFDLSIFRNPLLQIMAGALLAYGLLWFELQRLTRTRAHLYAAVIVAAGLCVYWLNFDHTLHAENRYYLRTALLVGLAGFGALAAAGAIIAEREPKNPDARLQRILAVVTSDAAARVASGALVLIMLVHGVETAKFVRKWSDYQDAVRALAMSAEADPALGDPRFISAARLRADLAPLAWSSTTPYLSVLVAPHFAPERIVVDPDEGYFWLSCQTATSSRMAARAIPAESRRLIRTFSCLHRKP